MTDTSLYIYICVKHFGMANIKGGTMVRLPEGITFFIVQRGHAGSVTHSTSYSINTEHSFLLVTGP